MGRCFPRYACSSSPNFAERFAPKVIAELRGRLDADGKSPFWEGLGRHFFVMEYSRADYLTGIGQKAFIAELMPRHPVYATLLPAAARAVIGEVHADSQPARAMLEAEGFRYEGYVDIFDAGPTLECFRDNIRAVRRSETFAVKVGEHDPAPDSLTDDVLWLVTNRSFERFRALLALAPSRIARFPAPAACRDGARGRRRRRRSRRAAVGTRSALIAHDRGRSQF